MRKAALFILILFIVSCNSSKRTFKPIKADKPNVVPHTKIIDMAAKDTIDIADDIEKDHPTEANQIKNNQGAILEESAKIKAAQDSIDKLEKNQVLLIKKIEELKESNEELQKKLDEGDGVIEWILYGFLTLGILMVAAVPLMIFYFKADPKASLFTGVTGAALIGISLFLIKYMSIVLWGIGILFVLILLYCGWQLIAYLRENKITDNLIETFNETDKEKIKQLQTRATQERVARKKIKDRTK